jgi:hypothetical protein
MRGCAPKDGIQHQARLEGAIGSIDCGPDPTSTAPERNGGDNAMFKRAFAASAVIAVGLFPRSWLPIGTPAYPQEADHFTTS